MEPVCRELTQGLRIRATNRQIVFLLSTILEKSELDPDWEWVRISLFPLKYRGVIEF